MGALAEADRALLASLTEPRGAQLGHPFFWTGTISYDRNGYRFQSFLNCVLN